MEIAYNLFEVANKLLEVILLRRWSTGIIYDIQFFKLANKSRRV